MRILVVEDEHKIAAAIKKGLEQEKYAVDLAYSGSDGFDLASTESYDCILLDVLIPGMDGITVCRKLREKNNHTPILMLTAMGQTEDKVAGLDSGADDYLTKPFSFEELLARVRALARRPTSALGRILKTADLTLDNLSYEVKRNGKSIQLDAFSIPFYLVG